MQRITKTLLVISFVSFHLLVDGSNILVLSGHVCLSHLIEVLGIIIKNYVQVVLVCLGAFNCSCRFCVCLSAEVRVRFGSE